MLKAEKESEKVQSLVGWSIIFSVMLSLLYLMCLDLMHSLIQLAWIRALKRHVQYIENEKLRRSTTPPEELPDEQGRRGNLTEAQRIAQYFDNDAWCASEASLDSDGLSVGNISNRTLQSIEEDLAFLQSRKKQMNSHSEIWDSNSLEFDGVGGDAEQQQRIYNRRPAQVIKPLII